MVEPREDVSSFIKAFLDQQEGLVSKDVCHQVRRPEFHLCDLHGGQREVASTHFIMWPLQLQDK